MSSLSCVSTRNRSNTFPQVSPFPNIFLEEYLLAEQTLQSCQFRSKVFRSFSPKFAKSAYRCFQPDGRKETVQSDLSEYSHLRQRMYPEYDPQRHLGYFINKSYPVGSHVLLHADFHGSILAMDAFSEQIRAMGYYPHANQMNPWKGRLVTLFLGDMVDRGIKSWETLRYGLQIPEVEMLRGNHESVDSNLHHIRHHYDSMRFMREDASYYFLDRAEKIIDIPFRETVNQFYSSLPLGAFISCSEKSPVKEHIMCTHGTFEVDMDVLDPLSRAVPFFCLEKDKPCEFSTRIQNILSNLPPSFHNPSTSSDVVQDYLESRLNSEADIQQIYSALTLEHFLDYQIEKKTSNTMRNFLFTKRKEEGYLNILQGRKIMQSSTGYKERNSVYFSSELMRAYYHLMTDKNNKIAYHVRGHDHFEEQCDPVYTLPTAPEGPMVLPKSSNITTAEDVFLDMTITGSEVKLWDCQRWARMKGNCHYRNTGKVYLKN
jgi:hypothetical protein